jgi:malate dehydrogenase
MDGFGEFADVSRGSHQALSFFTYAVQTDPGIFISTFVAITIRGCFDTPKSALKNRWKPAEKVLSREDRCGQSARKVNCKITAGIMIFIPRAGEDAHGDTMKKVSIIGSGNVGANSAFFIAENRSASVTLVDVREGLPQGKALDLSEAGPIRRYDTSVRGADSIDDIRGSDIVVIAAGRVRNPDETRDDLYRDNAALMSSICEPVRRLAPDAVVINIVEPVDLLTLHIGNLLGFDRKRVLGVGGLLSSTRLRHLVSSALGVSSREVTGMVIGPHRPSMVILRDTVRVSGIPAEKLLPKERFDAIVEEVRNAGDTILHLAERSTAYYAPSAAVAALVEAVARDTRAILPVSFRLEGEYGLDGIAVSVPACIGSRGVDHVVPIQLTPREKQELERATEPLWASLKNAAGLSGDTGGTPHA